MAMAPERVCTTTILVKNIHCASCVSTIKDLVTEFGDAISQVEVNTLSQEVHIVHASTVDILSICTALRNAAFEVHSAVSMDEKGTQVRALEFNSSEDDWFDRWGSSGDLGPQRHDDSASCIPLPNWRPTKARKHAQNCEACRRDMEERERGMRKYAQTNGDLEGGDLALLREPGRLNETQSRLHPISKEASASLLETSASIPSPTVPNADGRYEATISIGGMTCSSCTSAVDRGLSELAFVHSVNVNLMNNSATVIYEGQNHLKDVVQAVEDIGYDCTVDTYKSLDMHDTKSPINQEGFSDRTVQLKIDGIFCQHCPPQIVEGLRLAFPEAINIIKVPSEEDPILSISYAPNPPFFTIRDIVQHVRAINDAFTARIYNPPSIEQRSQAMQRQEKKKLLIRLLFASLVAIPTFLIGVVWMSLVGSDNHIRMYLEESVLAGSATRFEWALFFLATPVMFLAADVFHVRAIKEIRALWRPSSRVPLLRRFYRFGSMNLLISAGTSVAYFSSIAILALDATTAADRKSSSSTYFDSVVFLTFFILMGRWLEAYSRAKTGNAVAMLRDLRPETAALILPANSTNSSETDDEKLGGMETVTIDASLLEIGDLVLVRHGSSPPCDGTVVRDTTTFNESSLTGEARAVLKQEGDKVFAGTINVGTAVQIRITELSGASMLDQIVSVVREGQSKRAPVERVVDVVTGYFVPIITALAIITFTIWISLGYSGVLDDSNVDSQRGGWAFWSLEFAIAVFVVACPCGIGLAAPTALFVGSGLAAERGILVRGGGEAFQEASKVDCMVFDKTGTLTQGGDLQVTDYQMFAYGAEAETAWAATKLMEETSSHPIAQALLRFSAQKAKSNEVIVESVSEKPGMGLEASVSTPTAKYEVALGSERFLQSLTPAPPFDYFTTNILSGWKSKAKSVALLALRKVSESPQTFTDSSKDAPERPWTIVLIMAVSDPIRPSAINTISTLRNRNIAVYMLTGDNAVTASAVASTLSIPQDQVFAGVLPTEKADKIRWLQENFHDRQHTYTNFLPEETTGSEKKTGRNKKRKAIVAFVGDGINDAPALTAANVSVSFAAATDVAVQSASFVILSSTSSKRAKGRSTSIAGGANESREPLPSSSQLRSATVNPSMGTNETPNLHEPEETDTNNNPQHPNKNNNEIDNDPLPAIPHLLNLSSRVFRRVKFNFLWALIYNVILVPVAAGALFWIKTDGSKGGGGWRLGPVWGSAAMAGSSLCVIGSSAALRIEFDSGRGWLGLGRMWRICRDWVVNKTWNGSKR